MLILSGPSVPTYWLVLTDGVVTGVGVTGPDQMAISPSDDARCYTDRDAFEKDARELGYTGDLP